MSDPFDKQSGVYSQDFLQKLECVVSDTTDDLIGAVPISGPEHNPYHSGLMEVGDPFASPDTSDLPGKVEFGHGGRYRLPHPETGKITLFTRVSTIAHTIPDTFNLHNWDKRMVVVGMELWPELSEAARDLKADRDKQRLQALAFAAKERAGASVNANLGTTMHTLSEKLDRGYPITKSELTDAIDRTIEDYTYTLTQAGVDKYGLFLDQLTVFMHRKLTADLSMQKALADLAAYSEAKYTNNLDMDPELMERVVINMQYEIVGRIDRVGKAPHWPLPRIIDLKTGGVSYDHTAFLMQTALYANADLMWNEKTAEWEPFPKVDKEKAMILHLPVGEKTCDPYDSPIDEGWRYVKIAMHVREARKRGKEALTRYVDDSVWRARISNAKSIRDLSAIWAEAKAVNEWTMDLQNLGMKRREEILNEQTST